MQIVRVPVHPLALFNQNLSEMANRDKGSEERRREEKGIGIRIGIGIGIGIFNDNVDENQSTTDHKYIFKEKVKG